MHGISYNCPYKLPEEPYNAQSKARVPDYIITFIVFIAFLNKIKAAKLTSGNKVTLTRYN